MNLGETLEVCAIWLDGKETPEMRRQFEADVAEAVKTVEHRMGRILGPVRWTEKKPGDERVPPVPPHVAGPNVRLLVGEATVIGVRYGARNPVGFVHDLAPSDHALLRRVTQRKYAEQYPGKPPLTPRQLDTLINDLGPQAALDTLRGAKRSDLI